MLKGISPLLSPQLLSCLYEMGHADEILFADAHFPIASFKEKVIRADGLKIPDLLKAVLPLMNYDTYDKHPVILMAPVLGDHSDPEIEATYRSILDNYWKGCPQILKLERFEFYERVKQAYTVVMTGDTAAYANIILKKGVTF